MISNRRAFARNISSTFLVQIANYVFPMISVPIIVRIIGPEKYGLISYAGAIITYFTLLINYSFNLTSARLVAQKKSSLKDLNEIFSKVLFAKFLLFFISTVLFGLCFLVFPVFLEHNRLFLSTYLICAAWVLTPDWFYQGMGELHRVAIFNLMSKVIFTIIILIVIQEPSDYYWQPLSFSLAQLAVAGFSCSWAIRRFKLAVKTPSLQSIIAMLYSDRLIFFSTVIITLYTSTNILILAFMASTLEVGYFTAAQRFVMIAQAIITIPLSQSIFPLISQSFAQGRPEGLNMVSRFAPFVVIGTFVLGIAMIVVGPFLIEIYYGDKFNESILMFQVMAIIPFVVSISNLYGIHTMLNMQMDNAFLRIVASGAVLSILFTGILSKHLGGLGASIAWLVSECVIAIVMGIYLWRNRVNIFSIRQFVTSISLKNLN